MTKQELENYIRALEKDRYDFRQTTPVREHPKRSLLRHIDTSWLIIRSLFDFISLLIINNFRKKNNIIYTARNLCVSVNGKLEDRILKPISIKNGRFINYSKEYLISRINGQRVYNIGGVVKLLSKFLYNYTSPEFSIFYAYQWVNNRILKGQNGKVFLLCFYNLNGLSIVFSRYRANFTLCEVQHGSIINYPPYAKTAPVKIADKFYVKNESTINYLKNHLCKKFKVDYALIPYPKVKRSFKKGIHLLYASTVEFNGFHPVFLRFLEDYSSKDISLRIRLHPREKGKEKQFAGFLENIDWQFDTSPNWLENTLISNTIVVSPWSSCIEDAYDNNIIAVIIDPVGSQRYNHLLDNSKCFYSTNLADTITKISNLEQG